MTALSATAAMAEVKTLLDPTSFLLSDCLAALLVGAVTAGTYRDPRDHVHDCIGPRPVDVGPLRRLTRSPEDPASLAVHGDEAGEVLRAVCRALVGQGDWTGDTPMA